MQSAILFVTVALLNEKNIRHRRYNRRRNCKSHTREAQQHGRTERQT